jgi:AcrR family transcriptional regulator
VSRRGSLGGQLISKVRKAARNVRLAGEDLGGHRHVCALVDGPESAHELLLTFVVEGLEQGDRAFHIVDPQHRDAHLERLATSGIDVPALLASRQLEVVTWNDAYLRGGRFNPTAQIAYLRQVLRDGRAMGFPATRVIGSMDWARDPAMVADLILYEARLDDLLLRRPDTPICTYDVNQHSARTIVDVLDIHPVALVGGVLRTARHQAPESARDRILTAASQLFAEAGIQATGIDSLIAAAGVAKATFYRHFPSKDDLVVAWLRDSRTRWFDHVRAQVDALGPHGPNPISTWFDGVADWLEMDGYRGCPYLNVPVEITDPAHPAQPIVRGFLQEVEDYLATLLQAAGYANSRALAAQVQTLTAGSISLAAARRNTASVLTAREAAVNLLESAQRA